MRGIDVLADAFAGAPLPPEVRTPHAIVTADNLPQYYRLEGESYVLSERAPEKLGLPTALGGRRRYATPHVIGFMPHYPAHDWYRNMARAMRTRAQDLGLQLRISAPMAGTGRTMRCASPPCPAPAPISVPAACPATGRTSSTRMTGRPG